MTAGLADRRGECIHAACPHWRRCFVEHTVRRARGADLVVANHALVMAQAAWGGLDDATVPARYVFDEGHHVFDAADGAFAAEFSGIEAAELRRWLLGAEGGRSRARGLSRRLEELVAGDPALEAPLEAALQAARALPAPGWSLRLHRGRAGTGRHRARAAEPVRGVSAAVRAPGAGAHPPARRRPRAAATNATLFRRPSRSGRGRRRPRPARWPASPTPLRTLAERLAARLDDEAEELDAAMRNRIEAACRSLRRRALDRLTAWQAMLRGVAADPPEPGDRPQLGRCSCASTAARGARSMSACTATGSTPPCPSPLRWPSPRRACW